MGCHALQGTFPTQGWNPGLPYCRQILYHLSYISSIENPELSVPLSDWTFLTSNWLFFKCFSKIWIPSLKSSYIFFFSLGKYEIAVSNLPVCITLLEKNQCFFWRLWNENLISGNIYSSFSFLFFVVDDRIPLSDEASLTFETYHMIKVVPDSKVSKKIIEMFINSNSIYCPPAVCQSFLQTLRISWEQKEGSSLIRLLPHSRWEMDNKHQTQGNLLRMLFLFSCWVVSGSLWPCGL